MGKLFLVIGILGHFFWVFPMKNSEMNAVSNKEAAYQILQTKCNICHQKKKSVVFTEGNMVTWGAKIHKQVFVKKRMPKGKQFPLTEAEYVVLKNWLAELKIPEK